MANLNSRWQRKNRWKRMCTHFPQRNPPSTNQCEQPAIYPSETLNHISHLSKDPMSIDYPFMTKWNLKLNPSRVSQNLFPSYPPNFLFF